MNNHRFAIGLIVLGTLSSSASIANAGSLAGRATDLQGSNVSNVTIRVYSRQGLLLNPSQMFFASGDYNIAFNNNTVPFLNQAVTIVFSAPGRLTQTLRSVLGTSDQVINMVVPEAPSYGAGGYGQCQCQPQYRRPRCFRRHRCR